MRLKGVSEARRNRLKPPPRTTSEPSFTRLRAERKSNFLRAAADQRGCLPSERLNLTAEHHPADLLGQLVAVALRGPTGVAIDVVGRDDVDLVRVEQAGRHDL